MAIDNNPMFKFSVGIMQHQVHQLAKEKGWYDRERNPLELVALIMSELGEAVEAIRKPHESGKLTSHSNVEEELADAVIRILDMAGHYNYDLAGAILAKHEYNKGRESRHGGKLY